jgi:hypothetical protein
MKSRADKTEEESRARAIRRKFPALVEPLGFTKMPEGGCAREFHGRSCRIDLQKFRHQAAFRVWFYMYSPDPSETKPIVECSDSWTIRDGPGPKTYNFGIRWGDDAVDRCLFEIEHFVVNVVIPWAEALSNNETKHG